MSFAAAKRASPGDTHAARIISRELDHSTVIAHRRDNRWIVIIDDAIDRADRRNEIYCHIVFNRRRELSAESLRM